MKVVNLTPHALNLVSSEGETVATIPPSGVVARVSTQKEKVCEITVNGAPVPVQQTKFGKVTGLPDPEPGVLYVVSLPVAQALPEREDLLVVDDLVRDAEGRVVGARGFGFVGNNLPAWVLDMNSNQDFKLD
ncbi:MAG: hypothetical protein KM296_00355 [Brockia lithotrophica]|nr:hypothetical protein [Brockia lithotrophica]